MYCAFLNPKPCSADMLPLCEAVWCVVWCGGVVGGVCGVGVMYVQGSALPVQSNKNGSIRFSRSVE